MASLSSQNPNLLRRHACVVGVVETDLTKKYRRSLGARDPFCAVESDSKS
jgi:hypothetical protein